jgi:hypothetical protein
MDILYNITAPSFNMIFLLLVSIGFFVGIMLMVSPEAYETLDKSLQKEYGIKKRFVPKIEDTKIHTVDNTLKKYRIFTGMLISIISYLLLLIFK